MTVELVSDWSANMEVIGAGTGGGASNGENPYAAGFDPDFVNSLITSCGHNIVAKARNFPGSGT
jgi:hypothetical protein